MQLRRSLQAERLESWKLCWKKLLPKNPIYKLIQTSAVVHNRAELWVHGGSCITAKIGISVAILKPTTYRKYRISVQVYNDRIWIIKALRMRSIMHWLIMDRIWNSPQVIDHIWIIKALKISSLYTKSFFCLIFLNYRFVVIIYPFRARMQVKTCCVLIGMINLLAGVFTAPYAFHVALIKGPDSNERCNETWEGMKRTAYGAFTNIMQFVLPFVTIIFCYISIIRRYFFLKTRLKITYT
jgi:hypothetical protein